MIRIEQADATKLPHANNSFDLVFGSPPYAGKGQRYDGHRKSFPAGDWIDFMLAATREALRVVRPGGAVLWVANDFVRGGQHQPALAGLQYEAWKAGLPNERPVVWHKNAPPNRRDWFGNDYELVLAWRKPGLKRWDWEAIAEAPRYTSGGAFRQRNAKGERTRGSDYPQSKLARPRDVVRFTVGGGHLGHPLAHENEAPFPLKLAEHFIAPLCPAGGRVLDPFAGSGTTAHAAANLGRHAWISDVRESQARLAFTRLADTFAPYLETPTSFDEFVAFIDPEAANMEAAK